MRRTYSNRVSSFSQHRLAVEKEREGERETEYYSVAKYFQEIRHRAARRVEQNAWRSSLVVNDPVSSDDR